jgi:hypothetical protein
MFVLEFYYIFYILNAELLSQKISYLEKSLSNRIEGVTIKIDFKEIGCEGVDCISYGTE